MACSVSVNQSRQRRGCRVSGSMIVVVISAILFTCPSAGGAVPLARPNVVIIYCDDLGYGDLGVTGSRAIATPRIDRMAEEGVRLTDYYSCSGVCAPSRAGLLTGRYPFRFGIVGNVYPADEPFGRRFVRDYVGGSLKSLGVLDIREGAVVPGIPAKEILLSEALRDAGYRTGMVGKWHLGDYSKTPAYNPVHNGFDEYFGVPHSNDMLPCPLYRNDEMLEPDIGARQARLTGLYTEAAIRFVMAAGARPFFLYFAHTFPHQPLYASATFAGKSKAGKYGDAVEEIDWSVGRILDALDAAGVAENTLVLFTSDNGPWFEGSTGPFRGRKGQSYEGGFHVPFIARWPGRIPPGTLSSAPLMNIDIFPTVLALAGVPLPDDRIIDGRDMLAQLTGRSTASPHEALYLYHYDQLEGLRAGKWKYFRKLHRYTWPIPLDAAAIPDKLGKNQLGSRWPLLYDLFLDPGESYNVIDTYPEVAEKMEETLRRWESETAANPGGWF